MCFTPQIEKIDTVRQSRSPNPQRERLLPVTLRPTNAVPQRHCQLRTYFQIKSFNSTWLPLQVSNWFGMCFLNTPARINGVCVHFKSFVSVSLYKDQVAYRAYRGTRLVLSPPHPNPTRYLSTCKRRSRSVASSAN